MKNNNSIYFLFLISISQLTFAMESNEESSLPLRCEIFHCNKEFQYLDDLEEHLKSSHSIAISTLRMDLGAELVALLQAPSLNEHCEGEKQNESVHDEDSDDSENPIFRCHIRGCDKVYDQLHYLKRHLITHSDERPYQCDECGQGFKCMAHLKGHAKVHQNDYPYACAECQSAFKRSGDLNKHVKEVHYNHQKPHRNRKKSLNNLLLNSGH